MLSHLSALPSLLKPSGWKQQQRIFPREQASSPYLLCILSCFLRTTQSLPSHPLSYTCNAQQAGKSDQHQPPHWAHIWGKLS